MSTDPVDIHPRSQLHRIKFSILLIFQVPAYILSLFIFIFFIKNTRLLSISHNQALLILLVVNFIQLSVTLPMNLHFYAISRVSPATPTFCHWWIFIEFSLYSVSAYLMATISVQRHMLIFKGHWMRRRLIRYFLYYFPLLLSLIYPTTFYFTVIILHSCDGNQYKYDSNLCGFNPCYLEYNHMLGVYDWSVNNGVPMLIIALANIILVVRVIQHKRHQHRQIRWKEQRRMTIQLFYVSSLYLVSWSPCLIVALGQILYSRTFLSDIQTNYFLDLIYLVCLCLPWIIIGLLPELKPWLKSLICHQQVVPNVQSSTHLGLTDRTRIHPREK